MHINCIIFNVVSYDVLFDYTNRLYKIYFLIEVDIDFVI